MIVLEIIGYICLALSVIGLFVFLRLAHIDKLNKISGILIIVVLIMLYLIGSALVIKF